MSKTTYKVNLVFGAVLIGVVTVAGLQDEAINWSGLILVLLFYTLIYSIGVWASHKNQASTDSFILAGRKLPLWVAMLTMAATWLGGGYINGTAEQAYSSGLVWVQAPWGYGLSLVIGGIFFARKMRRFQFRTMLEPLEQRFGSKTTGLFFLPAVLGEIFWIAAILTALGTTFSVIIGMDTQTSIVLSAIIALLYTLVGGLWSVAYTDVIQLGLLLFGLVLALPFLLSQVGGSGQLWVDYKLIMGENSAFIPNKASMGNHFWNWLDFALLLILGGIPWQVYFQRVLSAKNENTAMYLSIFAGIICLVVAIPATMIGMVGTVTDWSSIGISAPASEASILPHVFYHLTPWSIALIGLAAIAAAVMSSIDSSMLSAGTLAVWNVYKPLIRPDTSKYEVEAVVKKALIIVCTAATLLSLQVESVYDLWYLCSDLVYCLLFPALTTALFDPRANRIGALAGLTVAAVLRLGGGEPTLGIPTIIPYPMIEDGVVLFPFRTLAMICGLLTIIVVSRLTQASHPGRSLQKVDSE